MGRKIILLAEDDAALRNLLKETLFNEFEVLEFSNYSEAINQSGNNVDLALIGYALPGKNLKISSNAQGTIYPCASIELFGFYSARRYK